MPLEFSTFVFEDGLKDDGVVLVEVEEETLAAIAPAARQAHAQQTVEIVTPAIIAMKAMLAKLHEAVPQHDPVEMTFALSLNGSLDSKIKVSISWKPPFSS